MSGAVVYRLYDRAGTLLYIGCTINLKSRFGHHRSNKPWFADVYELRTEPYETRREALAAEAAAIRAEAPLHNWQFTPKSNEPRPYLSRKHAWPTNWYSTCVVFFGRLHNIDLDDRLLHAGGNYGALARELNAIDPDVAVTSGTLRKWAEEIVVHGRLAS